jgi:hypothetical protein
VSNVQPTKAQTLGQHLDAVLAAAGHDVTIAKTDTVNFAEKAWTWIKGEWHNLVTAASTAYMALKMAGKL